MHQAAHITATGNALACNALEVHTSCIEGFDFYESVASLQSLVSIGSILRTMVINGCDCH
jgi:hypothetical protein